MNYTKYIKDYYELERKAISLLNIDEINQTINAILKAYKECKNIYVCGNGGSASTSSHFQVDFNKGLNEYLDKKFNFICLNDNVPTITAIANDIGYDKIFEYQLKNKINEGDLLICISASGNSKNIINAASYARKQKAKIIGITGFNGGKLKYIADYKLHVNVNDMQIVEDMHMTFDHMLMRVIAIVLKAQK